jgi:hypothetical protein
MVTTNGKAKLFVGLFAFYKHSLSSYGAVHWHQETELTESIADFLQVLV